MAAANRFAAVHFLSITVPVVLTLNSYDSMSYGRRKDRVSVSNPSTTAPIVRKVETSRTTKYLYTTIAYFSSFAYVRMFVSKRHVMRFRCSQGMGMSLSGPALQDLSEILVTSFSLVSYGLVANSVGYCCGTITGEY